MKRLTLAILALSMGLFGQASQTGQTAPKAAVIPLVDTELNRLGFFPNHVTIPAGKFRLRVRNRSGIGAGSFQVSSNASKSEPTPVNIASTASKNTNWQQLLDLPAGTYTITAPLAGKADRTFTLTLN